MKTKIVKVLSICLVALSFPLTMKGQDKVEASVGADFVSSYIWRGQELGDVSIQPSVSLSWKGLSLTAWGSVSWSSEYAKEFDLTLGYGIGGFSVSVTDYSFSKGTNSKTGEDISGRYFHFSSFSTLHVFEAQIGYDFGFLALNWYTNIGGNDAVDKKGDRVYSSYFSIAAPFKLGGIDWTATVGATPWETSFYGGYRGEGATGFAVCEVAVEAAKDIKLSEKFSLPLFAKVVWNPATENTYFTVGLSL